jgi:hypothetical protein
MSVSLSASSVACVHGDYDDDGNEEDDDDDDDDDAVLICLRSKRSRHGTLSVQTSSLEAHFRTCRTVIGAATRPPSDNISSNKNTPIPGLLHRERGIYLGQRAHVDAQRQGAIASAE